MDLDSYILAKGISGHERLEKLTMATWPISKPFFLKAGIEEAKMILDVGCGNGLITQRVAALTNNSTIYGLDYDAEIIHIARNLNQHQNIHFVEHNIALVEYTAKEQFDFIYARYLLSHVSNPAEIIFRLKKILKPNGILYLEDVDYSGHFSVPKSAAFDKYVCLYKKLSLISKANSEIGKLLFQLLNEANFLDTKVHSTNESFAAGIGKEIALITLQRISHTLINKELINKEELALLEKELTDFTYLSDTITGFPRIFYTWGRK